MNPTQTTISFEAIGTHWTISLRGSISAELQTKLSCEIQDFIGSFDLLYSRFNDKSKITVMSQKKGTYTFPKRDLQFWNLYRELYDLTAGQFTPMIGQVLSDAGYDAHYSLHHKKQLHVPPDWNEVLNVENYPQVHMIQPYLLDFGAAGKGYLIDLVGELLDERKVDSYIIDAGGDIRERNTENASIRVGLENPLDTKQIIGVVLLQNKSICGSAGNGRAWGTFNHIMNPYTLRSPSNRLAVWVIADSTMLADALTTALYFREPQELQKKYSFEYGILNSDFSYISSPGFRAELYKVQ